MRAEREEENSDVVQSMISSISELKDEKNELESQLQKLSAMLDDLLGYDSVSKCCP